MTQFGKLDYCQYLLSSPVNYTLTNLAEHLEGVSHDRINRSLLCPKESPLLVQRRESVGTDDRPASAYHQPLA